ncbi:MAG: PAS domain S-box protein [Desulfobacterales bacterium]|nr:PAS domain S-box protein [Desulfobacterales bacterium]
MKTKRFPWKLVTGSLASLAVVVAVVYLAYLFHRDYEDTVVSQTQQQLLMNARSIAVGIEEFIAEHSQDLRIISRNPKIQEKAYKSILVKKPPTKHCICQDLYDAHKDHVDAFTILDANGIMLRRIPHIEERIGEDHSDKPGVAYVLKEHKTHVSDVFYNNSENLAMSISEPVFYEDEFAGMVRWMIQVDTISKLFIETVKVGREGYAWMFDNKDVILAHPKKEFMGMLVLDFMRKVHKEIGEPFDETRIEEHIREEHDYLNRVEVEKEGYGMFLSCITGKDEVTAYKRVAIGDRNWHLIINLPYSEIAGPIDKHARNTFGVAGIAILLFGVGSVLLFRTQKRKAELETEAKYLKQVARSAEALRESREKLAGIIDSVTDHMVMVDEEFNIVWANDFAKEVFGPNLVGKKCYIVYHGRDEVCEPCIVKQCFEDGKVHEFETEIIVADGNKKTLWCTAGVSAWDEDNRPKMVVEFLRDITERKQVEEQIKGSLREKEVLLQEIHHRVKNNMQVISSLLKLQAGYVDDRTYVDMFKESRNRIISMALVHEKLYQSEDLASIDLNEYINHLANALFRSYGVDTNSIALKIDVADVVLGVDTAIPCGLIVNELISNSLKYAFPDGKKGEIKITLRPTDEDEVELTVSDNGVSIPDDLDLTSTESLGLKLVRILTDQLRGKLEIDRNDGTMIQIQFKKIEYKEMI